MTPAAIAHPGKELEAIAGAAGVAAAAAVAADRPVEETTVHTRLLRLALGQPESRAYWEHIDPAVPPLRRAAIAFEQRWFGGKSLPWVRVLLANFAARYDAFPDALREAGALLSWLSGSENVSASEKKAAGIKGDITSTDAMAYLQGILAVVRAAGYKGLVIVIDEAETILRMRSESRGKSLNGIRQIIDAADRFRGLLWVFTGTPDFFDTRRGVAGLQPLHDRIHFLCQDGVVTLRQPQLELKPFDRDRLKDVGLRLRQLYPQGDPNIVAQRVTPERIARLVDEVTAGFRGDVGVVPRQFLRRLVNLFDTVAENPDVPLPEPQTAPAAAPALAMTQEEERAAQGRKPYTYEPEADDDKGYTAAVEF